jgi:hypothetical protein
MKILNKYEIDIIIDKVTPCLWDVKENKYVDTTYEVKENIDKKSRR